MQCIADNLCHRPLLGEYDVGHSGEVFVEKASQEAWLQCFYQCREIGDIGEKRCDLATLPDELKRSDLTGQPLREVGREIARQRSMRPFGLGLARLCVAQEFDVP